MIILVQAILFPLQGIYTRIHDRGQKGQGVELVWGAGKGWARREEVEGLGMEEVLGGGGGEWSGSVEERNGGVGGRDGEKSGGEGKELSQKEM